MTNKILNCRRIVNPPVSTDGWSALTRTFFSFMSLCKRPWPCRKRIPSTTSRAIWSLSLSDKPAWQRKISFRGIHGFHFLQHLQHYNLPSSLYRGLCAAAPWWAARRCWSHLRTCDRSRSRAGWRAAHASAGSWSNTHPIRDMRKIISCHMIEKECNLDMTV